MPLIKRALDRFDVLVHSSARASIIQRKAAGHYVEVATCDSPSTAEYLVGRLNREIQMSQAVEPDDE